MVLNEQDTKGSNDTLLAETWASSRPGIVRQLSAVVSAQTKIMVTERIQQLDKVVCVCRISVL